ncbi:MAG TPA: SAM-dependent methyltransferase, partial [Nitrospiria bacterium]
FKKKMGFRFPGIILLGMAALLFWPSEWIKPRISEYKDLSIARNVAGARLLHEESGPLGYISVLENATIPFRHAPGLSLNFTGDLPEQLGIFVDGEGPMVMTRTLRDASEHDYPAHLLGALPFQILASPRVLVLGGGGGGGVLLAQYHQASAIDAVEIDPRMIDLVASRFSDFTGSLYAARNVRTFSEDARGFIRRKGKGYDLIQLSMAESMGVSAGGAQSISENFLLTVESFQDLYHRLAPGGILAVSRWIRLPPRDTLKLLATIVSALEESGVADPEKRIILARSWDTLGLFVKKGIYTPGEVNKAARFFESRGFDRVYDFLIQPGDVNRYHILERPEFYEAALALLGPDREKFIDDYKFDIRPARDDRPFFSQFFRWKTLPEIRGALDRGGAPLMEWGYLLLWATVIQALLAGVVLILLPLKFFMKKKTSGASRFRFGIYFFLLGLAFLIIEIILLKKFILFLNHPIYASALVISIFLVSAGTGSGFISGRYGGFMRTLSRPILLVAVLLILWGALFLGSFPFLVTIFGGSPYFFKVLVSIGLLFPMGFLMGIPFPLGLLQLGRISADFIPWAWGINGVASVMSTVLGALLAFHWGFSFVFALGLFLYLVSAFILPVTEKQQLNP